MRFSIAILLALLTACSSDPAPEQTDLSTASDAANDTRAADSGEVPGDAASPADIGGTPDAGADAATSQDLGVDAATADMSAADMGTSADPYAGRPTGQCVEDADCPVGPNGQMCSRTLPGGACLGCGDDTHCPTDTVCSQFGACITECSTDDECAPGLHCLGSGRCAALDCAASACPVALFGCDQSDRCERVDCSSDATVCPAETTCTAGICIENRALNP